MKKKMLIVVDSSGSVENLIDLKTLGNGYKDFQAYLGWGGITSEAIQSFLREIPEYEQVYFFTDGCIDSSLMLALKLQPNVHVVNISGE